MSHFQLQQEIENLVRHQIGAVASLKSCVVVKRLPKTRSGKTLRRLLRSLADGEAYQIPSTIDDESIIEEIEDVLKEYKIGFYKTT